MKITKIIEEKGIEIETPKKLYKRRRLYEEPEATFIESEIISQSLENNHENILKQIENNHHSNSQSIDNDTPTKRLALDNTLDKASSNHDLIIRQSLDIDHLVGKEKILICHIVTLCKNRGSLETDTVTSAELKNLLEVDNNGLANIIFRVKDKGYLTITEQKKGRVSWRKFTIPKNIYEQIIRKGLENHSSTISESSSKPLDKALETDPNSSSINIFNKETTIEEIQIPENLKNIISQKEIKSLIEKKTLSEEDLKTSLEHFSHDYKNNLVKAKTSPVNLFFGLARSGKVYRSIDIIKKQNEELAEYIKELEQLEKIEKELKTKAMRIKFQEYKKENPEFLEKVKSENTFLKNEEILENVAFQKFTELNND